MRHSRQFMLNTRSCRDAPGVSRFVHVISRTAGQEILFGDVEKETFCKIFFKQLKFSGLRAIAWCFMGNHFHLLLEVPEREVALAGMGDEEVLGRLAILDGEMSTKFLLVELETCRRTGDVAGIGRIAEQVRGRLFDLSKFMKELKLKFTLAYSSCHGRRGALWDGRFKSLLVEGGDALRTVAAYIDLNPVRAGLVKCPEDYRWCSYAAAVEGMRLARSGLLTAICFERKLTWARAAERYRELLFGTGVEVRGGQTSDGSVKSKGGVTQREIEAVLDAGGKLSLAQALRCRVRYFSDGVVLGSQEFVDNFFETQRGMFGDRRTTGGRRMKGAHWGDLRILRNLKDRVLTP